MAGSAPTMSFAIACGAAGAMVDVSDFMESEEDLTWDSGTQSGFEDVDVSSGSVVLRNHDGRFTPLNPASALATTLRKGMVCSWQTNTRLIMGTIQSVDPTFPNDIAAWSEVTVTFDDATGTAARHTLDDLAAEQVLSSGPYLFYRLNDAEGSVTAVDSSASNAPALRVQGAGPASAFTLGAPGVATAVGDTQLEITSAAGASNDFGCGGTGVPAAAIASPAYPAGSLGFVGFWVTPSGNSANWGATLAWAGAGLQEIIVFQQGTAFIGAQYADSSSASVVGVGAPIPAPGPLYIAVGITYVLAAGVYTITLKLYINGILAVPFTGTTAVAPPTHPSFVQLGGTNGADTVSFSHFSHTPTLVHEELAGTTTEAGRLQALATAGGVALAALAGLSTQPIGFQGDLEGSSAFDGMNTIARTEQGYLYTVTGGTLLAPTQTVKLRPRDRPTAVSWYFSAVDDLSGAPDFGYDVTDTVAAVDVTATGGISVTVNATDPAVAQAVGNANDGLAVAFAGELDAYTAGTDRLARGTNPQLRVASIVIDARITEADRWADLLAMVHGDRVQVTDLAVAQLGITTWDGWFIGVQETHTTSSDLFEIFLEPCMPATAVFDTNLFDPDGALTLSAAITSGAASMSVATSVPAVGNTPATLMALTGAGITPYTVLIDQEQITVTACSNATPQVATITRGVNGTVAAAHAAGAVLKLAVPSLFAY